jgi:hypothetical protein
MPESGAAPTRKEPNMALKIKNFTLERVEGILDDSIPFTMIRDGKVIVAWIGNWTQRISVEETPDAPLMRSTAYQVLARYREQHRLEPSHA